MADVITLRIGKSLLHDLDVLSEEQDKDRSELVRELLTVGVRERKIQAALALYSAGKVSLWKAAGLAGTSLWRMIDLLREHKIQLQYGLQELREDFEPLDRT